jgi:hypothetical protein
MSILFKFIIFIFISSIAILIQLSNILLCTAQQHIGQLDKNGNAAGLRMDVLLPMAAGNQFSIAGFYKSPAALLAMLQQC